MLVGDMLLYDILRKKDIQALASVKRKWLEPEEIENLERIYEYLGKYNALPPAEEVYPEIPIGYVEGHPTSYWAARVRDRYAAKLLNGIRDAQTSNPTSVVLQLYYELLEFFSNYSSDFVVPETSVSEFIKNTLDSLRIAKVTGLYGLPTSWSPLDRAFGGYRRGEVYVFVARLKMGKTMCILRSLYHLLIDGRRCMFISMEMALDAIARRLIALKLGHKIPVDPERMPPSFIDESIRTDNWKLTLVNGASLRKVTDISALIDVHNPEIVFIDGAYLLPAGRFKSEWEKAKYVIEKIKHIAMAKNVPIVCTYQLNRNATKVKESDVDVQHVALSDSIAQTATAVIAIVKDGNSPYTRRMKILANRDGSTAEFTINFKYEEMDFSCIDEVRVDESEIGDTTEE